MTAIAGQLQGGCAAVVTHAGVIRTFLGSLAELQHVSLDLTQCGYASCWEVWCDGGQWHLPFGGTALNDALRQVECRQMTL